MRSLRQLVVVGLAAALVLAGCSPAKEKVAPTSGLISANSSEPQGLVPWHAVDPATGRIVKLVYGQLVDIADDGTVVHELAESIETKDSRVFTITLRPDLRFSNGEPIDAASFVDSWNYTVGKAGDPVAAAYFAPIEGYAEVVRSAQGKQKAPAPTATEMPSSTAAQTGAKSSKVTKLAGLKVLDELRFRVTLTSPESDFPTRLAEPVYSPVPASAFSSLASFSRNPAACGPYQLKEGGWIKGKQLNIVKNGGYTGPREPANSGISFVFYASAIDAYQAFTAGNLDVLDQIPATEVGTYDSVLGNKVVNEPIADLVSLTIPARLDHFRGKEGALRRTAISLAIDRPTIASTVLNSTVTPATDFTSPAVQGWSQDLTGVGNLAFDPQEAQRLWAQADQISPWSGPFELAYNTDGGHAEWVAAVLDSISRTLGIEVHAQVFPTITDLQAVVADRSINVPFRSAWRADHASAYNFLAPTYSSGAAKGGGFNDGDYSSKAFDAALGEAASAPSVDESLDALHRAEQQLLKDLPGIPLWDTNAVGAHSARIGQMTFAWDGNPVYYRLTTAPATP